MWVGRQKRRLRGWSVLGHLIGFWRPETRSFPGVLSPSDIRKTVLVAGQAGLGVPPIFEPSLIGEYRLGKAGAKDWGQPLSGKTLGNFWRSHFFGRPGPLHNPIPLWLYGGIFLYKNHIQHRLFCNRNYSRPSIPLILPLVTLFVDDCCSRLLELWTKKTAPQPFTCACLPFLSKHTHSAGWLPYSRNGLQQPCRKPLGCLSHKPKLSELAAVKTWPEQV